jgi:hypothetical protein
MATSSNLLTSTTGTFPKLPLLGTTALSSPSSPAAAGSSHRLACNPAIDLTATVGDAGAALLVWRSSSSTTSSTSGTGGGGSGGGNGDDDGDRDHKGLVSKCVERGRRVEGGVVWKDDGMYSIFSFFGVELGGLLWSGLDGRVDGIAN